MRIRFKTLYVEKIELTDGDGQTRASLECKKGRVRLRLLDGSGVTRVAVSVDEDGKIEPASLNQRA